MITQQEREKLALAMSQKGTGDLDRVLAFADQAIMPVENILQLIQVRATHPAQIWDMDGTLADSEPVAFSACAAVMNRLGKRKGHDFGFTGPSLLEKYVGRSFSAMVRELQLIYNFDISESELRYFAAMEKRMVMNHFRNCGLAATPGSKDLIHISIAVGFRIAIASSSTLPRILLCKKLLGLDCISDTLCFSGTDMGKSKPAPDVYLKAAAALDAAPDQCISFEDEEPGVQAAHAAGIGMKLGIIVLTPPARRTEHINRLRVKNVDAVAEDFREMPALMYRLSQNPVL